ncbi:MAG: GTP cyclohydrolase IIa [Staphylothermus sp.]|nr:GTP cyclohydrolase IIa [Staphylothermus sp.]
MPRITLIKLLRYREWTEELGYDREWIIQSKQAKIYDLIQILFSKKNGFAFPLRYDYFIALSNGIDEKTHYEILMEIDSATPYGIKMVSLTHKYPAIAQLIASHIIRDKPGKLVFLEGDEDNNVVAHIDFNNITLYTDMTSVFESYLKIQSLYYNISKYAFQLGGISTYLGGDNMVVILPEEKIDRFLENLPYYLKIGIGVSSVPRKAMSLASKALTMIREGLVRKNYIILRDESDENI